MAQRPIEVFYWPTPNGHKPVIALEEMGLPYVIRPVNIMSGDQFTPEFLKISPNNRMPAIIDPDGPDGKPISVFESGAILQYLGRKTGKFYGKSERERVEIDQWIHWQMAGLGPNAGQANHFKNYAPKLEPDPAKLKYAQDRFVNELNRLVGVLDRRLADREFIAGAYSLADMMIWPWGHAPGRVGLDVSGFKNFAAYMTRVGERAAVKKALKVGEGMSTVLPSDNSKEAEKARKVMFGQTAQSVAAAASAAAGKKPAAKSGAKPAPKAAPKTAAKGAPPKAAARASSAKPAAKRAK
jgi:glutathione S-transferase